MSMSRVMVALLVAPLLGGSSGGALAVAGAPETVCADGERVSMSAFEVTDGHERWTTCADVGESRFVVGADDERVIVTVATSSGGGGRPSRLEALDAAGGTVLWAWPVPGGAASAGPASMAADVVVMPVWDGPVMNVIALDAATGIERWAATLEQGHELAGVTDEVVVVRTFTSGDEPVVVAPGGSGTAPVPMAQLTGYDTRTGAVRWTSEVPAPSGPSFARGAAGDGRTIVVGGATIVALDVATGAMRWEAAVPLGDVAIGAVVDGVVITGGQDDDLTVLSLATGEMMWSRSGSPPYGDVWAAADGAVYVRDGGDVVAYAVADGDERWRVAVGRESYVWPWYADTDAVYTMWWNLEARSPLDGGVMWATDHPIGREPIDDTPRMASLARAGNVLVVTYAAGVTGGD